MKQISQMPALARDSLFSDMGLNGGQPKAARPSQFEDSLPNEDKIPWQRDLLEVFLRNQLKLAPTMPLIALVLSLTAARWNGAGTVASWLLGVVGSNLIQLFLCKLYFKTERSKQEQHEWIGMMAASELMQGMFWVLPLFFFWPGSNSQQGTFLVAGLMAVSALRFLIVNNFMPVLIAGTGVMTIGVALRCIAEQDPVYYSLGGILITLEVFFLFVARQLQETARDMVIFKNQKDALIAELSAARDQAESERTKAEKANHAKTAFLANMSHELRTPLNAILGFSEILQAELFGPMANHTYKDYAGDINSSGRYLLGLINDILDISRIEAGRREIQEEPVNLLEELEHAQHLLEINAARKDIMVTIDVRQDVPKVLADERAVQQVAINLLTNAIKFTPRGGKVELGASRLANGAVELHVKDNGPGIPPDEVKQAISAFTRGRLATRKAVDGAGLGLSIVNGIMQLHGGSVAIQSEVGQGTNVICTFPAKRVLSGPRNSWQASNEVKSETQRQLISVTG
ncbi:MAG: HAMP domain-containing histidine kinase [Alphaproteobacteria bacterium]|nr:HAMP domain-containing histidine kinase [Alphaproteobacteria bacterium]